VIIIIIIIIITIIIIIIIIIRFPNVIVSLPKIFENEPKD